MSWASNDQREAVDGNDAEGREMYSGGMRDSTGIRFELDALVVTLAVALGGALLDALLLHTLRIQLRATLASSDSEPSLQQPGGENSTVMLMARRTSWGAARIKLLEELAGKRRAAALPIALLMSNCVCSAMQCALAVPPVTIEVFLPGTRSKLDAVCNVLFAFEHLLFSVPFWNVVAATAATVGVQPPEESSGARTKRSTTGGTKQKPELIISRLEFTLRISLPWLVSAVSAVAVALLTFQLDPTAEWERVLHGEETGPGTGQESEDRNEDGGSIRRNKGTGAEYVDNVCVHRSDVACLVGRVSCFFVPAFLAGCCNCKALYEHYTLSGVKKERRRSSGGTAARQADVGRGIMGIGLLAMGPSAPPAALPADEPATCPPGCACRCHLHRGASASRPLSRTVSTRASRAVRRFSNTTWSAHRAESTLSRGSRSSSRRVVQSAADSDGQEISFGGTLLFSTLSLMISALILGPYVANEMLQSLCICAIRSKLHPGYNFLKNQRFSCGGLMGNMRLLSALKWMAYLHSLFAPLSALAASGELRAAALSSLVCHDPDASMPEELERRFSFGAAAAAAALFEDSPTDSADAVLPAGRTIGASSSADCKARHRQSPPVARRAAMHRMLNLRRISEEESEGESGKLRAEGVQSSTHYEDSDLKSEHCRLLRVEGREGAYGIRHIQSEEQTPDEQFELEVNGLNRILL